MKREWTLTSGYAVYKNANGKRTKEKVIIAVGPMPSDGERIVVVETPAAVQAVQDSLNSEPQDAD